MSDTPKRNHLDDLPRMHSREARCRQATLDLSLSTLKILGNHDLTDAEALRVVHEAYSTWVSSHIKYAIREERHPGEPDKPGGIE